MTREWFTTYCQNVAANVLDKDGKVRFDYTEVQESLDAASRHDTVVHVPVMKLHDNIVKLCDARNEPQKLCEDDEWTLLSTLLNIHAAYLMISGLWHEKPAEPEGVDEYGFEIF